MGTPGAQRLRGARHRAEQREGPLGVLVELPRLEPDEQVVRGGDLRGQAADLKRPGWPGRSFLGGHRATRQ
ncbi:hypothetical protein ACFCXA_03985 [Streptomyces virginiae]|uniref:hypothetical protein n=1 Tax=Streptomyces virginiae TaxID=1961 RepID=UPI003245A3B3